MVCFNILPMSVFNGKTHNIQTRKYDVSMTSPVTKKIQFVYKWNVCFLLNIAWKFRENLDIFHENI